MLNYRQRRLFGFCDRDTPVRLLWTEHERERETSRRITNADHELELLFNSYWKAAAVASFGECDGIGKFSRGYDFVRHVTS